MTKKSEWRLAQSAVEKMASGDWRDALSSLDAALRLRRDPVLLRLRAACLEKIGRMPEALADLEKAEAMGDRGAETAAQKGHVLFYLKRYDEAAEAFRAALRGDRTSAVLRRALMEALWLGGRRREAARLARGDRSLEARWIAAQAAPRDRHPVLRAGLLMQTRDFEAAAKAFQRAGRAADGFFGLAGVSGETLARALALLEVRR